MLVIEPTNGRELTHWSQLNWTAVAANVRHLQGRIYRAAAHEDHAQVKNLQKLMVRSMSAGLSNVAAWSRSDSSTERLPRARLAGSRPAAASPSAAQAE